MLPVVNRREPKRSVHISYVFFKTYEMWTLEALGVPQPHMECGQFFLNEKKSSDAASTQKKSVYPLALGWAARKRVHISCAGV